MSATRLALAALALLLSAGCAAPIETGFDHDDEQDFSGYTTYQWQQPAESVLTKHGKPVSNDLLDARVKSAVNAELGAKGMKEGEEPQFFVIYYAAIDHQIDVTVIDDYYGEPWHSRSGTYIRQYDRGTLLVDVVDAERNKIVWRGIARGEVDLLANAKEKTERINEAVRRIFRKFPPPQQ